MNYGKRNSVKKQKKISSKSKMKKKRAGVRIFKGFLIVFLLLIIVGLIGGGLFLKKILDEAPKISPASVKPSGYFTTVYNADGSQELEKFVTSGSNRIYKTIDEIPEDLQDAFVAIEDERFYRHNGIDIQGILRAGLVGITSGNFSEGASTITQQLIKNNVFPNFTHEKTFLDSVERKVQEQFLAIELEKQMSKEEILENYMNTINLGQNTLGVQSAAKRYFNKDVSQLTLSECTVIAGITQNPGRYDPTINPKENAKRRKIVLGNMLEQKYISQEEYDTAMADPVYDRIQVTNADTSTDTPYTYFIDELSKQVISDLQTKLGYTETQAYNALYSGGLSIYATQDARIQQIADEEFLNPDNYPYNTEFGLIDYQLTITRSDGTVENFSKEMLEQYLRQTRNDAYPLVFSSPDLAQAAIDEYKSTISREGDTQVEKKTIVPQPQASFVIMDQYTGEVKAIVGGRGEKTESLSLNRATESPRQPGSCFKIVSTYAPALDIGAMGLHTSIKDEPYRYKNGKEVNNWDFSYKGYVTVRKAIEQSMNVVAVKTLTEIGEQTGFDYLKSFGFSTVVDQEVINGQTFSDIQQATALGGITHGVYNLEMTAAYAALANNGTYTKPKFYTKILDHSGNVLIDNTAETHQVVKASTAGLLTNAMMDVVTKGTGTGAALSNMPVSGKTGTTSDNVDIWFSGYTPYYTASVWGGYDSNKPMDNTTWHLTLWRSIMERVHEGLEYKEFTMPDTVKKTTVCASSGKLPLSSCPQATEYVAMDSGQKCNGKHGGYYTEPEETEYEEVYEYVEEVVPEEEHPEEEQKEDPSNPDSSGNQNGNTNPENGNNPEGGNGSNNGTGGDQGGGETTPPDQGDGSVTPEG